MMPPNGRFAPPTRPVPAQVLTAMFNQSKNRVQLFGDLATKLRGTYRQLQIDCNNLRMMMGQDQQGLYQLAAYQNAAAQRLSVLFQGLEALAQADIEWQGEAQRWLGGLPPSILDVPVPQQQPPQAQGAQPMMQASGGGPMPAPNDPSGQGIFARQRNGIPQGAQMMPVTQMPVQQVPGVGVPPQMAPQQAMQSPQGGMVQQAPMQPQGLPVVQFGSPQEASAAATVAHATGAPIAPAPAPAPANGAPNGQPS